MSALLLAKVSTPNEQRCACRFIEPYHARAKALTEAELGTHRTAPANGPPLTPARPLPRSFKLYSNFKLLTCLDVITSGTGNPVRSPVRMQSRTTSVGKRIPLKLSKQITKCPTSQSTRSARGTSSMRQHHLISSLPIHHLL